MEITNSKGLKISILPNGAVGTIEVDAIRINLRPASIHGASGSCLYARIHDKNIHLVPLVGPLMKGSFGFADNRFYSLVEDGNLKTITELKPSPDETAWMWTIMLRNTGHNPMNVDAIFVQDVGLRQGAQLVNEYYVSQYTERRLFDNVMYGKVAACRQNMRESTGNPWLMMACPEGAVAGATDGAQIFGPANRHKNMPPGLLQTNLGGEYAGESSLLALQSKMLTINPGGGVVLRYIFVFMADHAEPSSSDDAQRIRSLLGSFEAFNPMPYIPWKQSPRKSIFYPSSYCEAKALTNEQLTHFFGSERNHAEYHEGRLMSFFTHNGNHIVLKDKELIVDRPHGHIIRSGMNLLPDERIMSSNPFMAGIFNAHITAGNTNFNVLHSIYSNQFGLASPAGQRVFIKKNTRWYLLGVPSAFEMGFNFCRWIYNTGDLLLEIVTWTSTHTHQVNFRFRILQGNPTDIRITNHFDPGSRFSVQLLDNYSAIISPASDSLMGSQFPGSSFAVFLNRYTGLVEVGLEKGIENNDDLLVYGISGCNEVQMSIGSFYAGEPIQHVQSDFDTEALSAQSAWKQLTNGLEIKGKHPDVKVINTILPWFGTNALTHYLTPYGLEQFGGAAWGTRDVSQGPVELMLSLGRYSEAKEILRTIFSNQHPDGGWPQWWMFDSYARIRAHEAHGDITYWVMIALSHYLIQTGDYDFLQEKLPWFNPAINAFDNPEPLAVHVEKWLGMITSSFISGTSLVPFDGGDWNDSLQPASSLLAARLISSWTVQMSYQAFRALSVATKAASLNALADRLLHLSSSVREDFHAHLVKDGVVAGYGKLEDDGKISLLLHPSDYDTGISYSILPMNRGVLSNIFSPAQANEHFDIIKKHLKGPDGARLMDKPLKYTGGKMRIFQRAETSTFFGREIGLMYVHEHIRHAEALATLGRADEFVAALRQAVPVEYQEIVTNAVARQSNCYYSSSDIIFRNRYAADEQYHLLNSGSLTFRGGWRVYSSGPGIFVALIITKLLGFRINKTHVVIDPVMPDRFNGLEVTFFLLGKPITLKYSVLQNNHTPQKLILNGRALIFAIENQSFRRGGAILSVEGLKALLKESDNILEIII